MARSGSSSSALRRELEQAILYGQCAYCRRPGSPGEPLTREHVIPRARGGGRKDVRIIVPACARCNHRRGCKELVSFLLLRPRRISAFLDHLAGLSPESLQQLDVRVFAELYAAIWMLRESSGHGAEWRSHLRRMCSGRTLHRRRYAARRMVGAVSSRVEPARARGASAPEAPEVGGEAGEPPQVGELATRLIALLARACRMSPEEARHRITLQQKLADGETEAPDDGVVRLDGWRARRRRRLRVDRRGGRAAQVRPRGRAA